MTPFHCNVVPITFVTLVACVVALPKESRRVSQAPPLNVEDDPQVQLRRVSPAGGPAGIAKHSELFSAPPRRTKTLMRRQRKREKNLTSKGTKDIVASLADIAAGLVTTQTRTASGQVVESVGGRNAPAEVAQDGLVTVVNPADNPSEVLKLEEMNEECMHEHTATECEEKYGSYGAKHMHTEDWINIKRMGWRRQGWMSHPNVQKKKLFDLTLPGSAKSGTYASDGLSAIDKQLGRTAMARYGANDKQVAHEMLAQIGDMTQDLDLHQQMEMGIRAFEIKVGYNTETKLVHVSSGSDLAGASNLLVPIATLMRDMRRFLEEYQHEVVVLDIKKDLQLSELLLGPINAEETNPERVPGQLVHDAVQCELREMLATYKTLSQLPNNEMNENPTIGALTEAGVQVIYFWEGQQVLCLSYEECKMTPGWIATNNSHYPKSLPFGVPYAVGERRKAAHQAVIGNRTVLEPACQAHSQWYTDDNKAEHLYQKATAFCKDIVSTTKKTHPPTCYPYGVDLPPVHSPSVWYTLEAYTTPSAQEAQERSEQMRGIKAIYTKGEGVTIRSDAERTNYILLTWLQKANNQPVFTKPNAIFFEFVGSAYMNIIRMVEVMQGRPECGFAIYCKKSGSCWADTLLGDKDECLSESSTEKELAKHANDWGESGLVMNDMIVYLTIGLLGCCAVGALVYLFDYVKRVFKTELPLQDKFDKYMDPEGEQNAAGSVEAVEAGSIEAGAGEGADGTQPSGLSALSELTGGLGLFATAANPDDSD